MVQASETSSIMREWKERGRPLCRHPQMEREYAQGAHTGDDICMNCGAYRYLKGPKPRPCGVAATVPTTSGEHVTAEITDTGDLAMATRSPDGSVIRALAMTPDDARELAEGLRRAADAFEGGKAKP